MRDLLIRPAREDDRAAVLEFTAPFWDGHDYIGAVWDDWMSDRRHPLLVGQLGASERPIALVKLSDLGQGQGWIHGVRVAQPLSGRGIARALIAHCIDLALQAGMRSVRLMTAETNQAMQHIARSMGFRLVVAARWYSRPREQAAPTLEILRPDALGWLLERLPAASPLAQTESLYSAGWRFRELTPQRLAAHLDAGQVLALPDRSAWALVVPGWSCWIGCAEGQASALVELLGALPRQPFPEQEPEIVALVPADSLLAAALALAGYQADGSGERCYELVHPELSR